MPIADRHNVYANTVVAVLREVSCKHTVGGGSRAVLVDSGESVPKTRRTAALQKVPSVLGGGGRSSRGGLWVRWVASYTRRCSSGLLMRLLPLGSNQPGARSRVAWLSGTPTNPLDVRGLTNTEPLRPY